MPSPSDVSNATQFGAATSSSGVSSMVTSRSCGGISATSAFMKVVLPESVAPPMIRLQRPRTATRSRSAASPVRQPPAASSSSVSRRGRCLRMHSACPRNAVGARQAATRMPSKRASIIPSRVPGVASRRDRRASTFTAACTCASVTGQGWRSMQPARCTHSSPGALSMISVTVGSSNSGDNGASVPRSS